MDTPTKNVEIWNIFQEKVEDLFTTICQLPDELTFSAVQNIEGRLASIKKNLNELSVSPITILKEEKLSPSRRTDVELVVDLPDDLTNNVQATEHPEVDASPRKRKRGRPPGKREISAKQTPTYRSPRLKQKATQEIKQEGEDVITGFTQHGNVKVEKEKSRKLEENRDFRECERCHKVFQSASGFNVHMKKHEDQQHPCMHCDFNAVKLSHLQKHVKNEHGIDLEKTKEKKFSCTECGKSYRTLAMLNFHMSLHQKGPLKCSHCPKEFISKLGYDQHIKQHLGKNLHCCGQCDYTSPSVSIINAHVRTVHDKVKKYLCDMCGREFATSFVLQKHKEGTHWRSEVKDRYSCSECDHKTHCSQSLKAHIRNVHTKTTGFICNICGITLKYKHSLKLHQMRHYSWKNFQCSECDFRAICEKNVKEHYKRIHCQPTHKCDTCEKVFNDRSHLIRHQVVHTGEKKFTCSRCNYRCNVKSNIRKHMVKIHKVDERVRSLVMKVDQDLPEKEVVGETASDAVDVNVDAPAQILVPTSTNIDYQGVNVSEVQETVYVQSQQPPEETYYKVLNIESM